MGTAFYSYAENLSFVDAFYFSGATLTTLGYGDIVPTNDASKIFTVFYALLGIGLIFYIFTEIFRLFFTGKLLKHEKKKS
tara:strand:+ start:28127 stop:28366 length:240 start_codon:yes stop_codon:yes gene_type:complete